MSETSLRKPSADVVSITIDGKSIEAKRGTSVLEAARQAGIYIPHLCDHRSIKPYAGCRLCLVEIEGQRGLDTSCTVPVAEGMIVRSNTQEIREMQRDVLEIILSDHPDRCLNCSRLDRCPPFGICQRDDVVTDRCVVCPRNGQCELQKVVDFLQLRRQRFCFGDRRSSPPEHSNPFIERNADYCIWCTRCVRVCAEVRGIGALGPANRGPHDQQLVDFDTPLTKTNCEFCGQCALVCPTGAIVKFDSKHGRVPDETIATTCGYCAVGCGLNLNLRQGQLINVTPQVGNCVNDGCLCVKGHFGYDYITAENRLTQPLMRENDGSQATATWDEALDAVAKGMLEIKDKYGPDSIGFIASAKATNEDNYVLQKLARVVIGTNNIDQAARFLYAPTIEALGAAFGMAGSTNPIADIDQSGCLMVAGANVTETHTILGLAAKRAAQRGAKVIVIDPREIPLVRFAELWLRPKLGTDGILVNGILKVILDEGLADLDFIDRCCEGFQQLKESLAGFDLTTVERISGVPKEQIRSAARLFARGGQGGDNKPLADQAPMARACYDPTTASSSIIYGAGIVQHENSVQTIAALANLAMITGNLGKVGGGIHALSGENNTVGACDVGALPDYLPGYRPVSDEAARADLSQYWEAALPKKPGLTLLEMLEGARTGNIKALYITGSDLLLTAPDGAWVKDCLQHLSLLVVQDVFSSAATPLAHVVLPSVTFAEKEGTFTNTERRVQRIRRALSPICHSKPDWQIVCELGDRMLSQLPQKPATTGFFFVHPSHILEEMSKVMPSYTGISQERLEQGGLQWPCPDTDHPGTAILFEEGFPRGKGMLAPAREIKDNGPTSSPYPLQLMFGGLLYHHGTGALSRASRTLVTMQAKAHLEVNEKDAVQAGLSDGDEAQVTSSTGTIDVYVKVTPGIPEGIVFLPTHFNETPIGNLIPKPSSLRNMPTFKGCPVKLEKKDSQATT